MNDNDYKYLFGYYSVKEKIWYIQPRKFMILKDTNKNLLIGQFIQSSWFCNSYSINSNPIFVVFKVYNDTSCKKIEKDINSLKNPFPTLYDIPPYVIRYSYFNMPWQLVNQCIKELTVRDNFKFTIRAFNNPYDKLILDIRKNYDDIENQNTDIVVSLPSFEIPIKSE